MLVQGYGRLHLGTEIATENRFTGQKRDGTGLQYYNARYYDPELGQFLSPDTLVPDPGNLFDYNRYMYVRGNPMNAVDPSGHICVPVVNIGNTCQGSTDWDAVQSSLDATGIVDPTPISDGVNAVISVARGNYVDAGLSAVAIVPYIGDLAKGGKYLDEAAAGARWVGDKADEGWQAAKRWTDCLINSFSAKTLVMTPAGLKAISELVEGDLVLAYNETTGEIGAYPITDVISHVDPEIVLLTIDDETLETTAEHPFYELESAPWLAVGQTEGRWTDALDLQAGDRVWQADGSSGVVQSVEVASVPQRMYNLTVDEAHTFFVGDGQWLVHNCRDPVHHIATNKSLKGTSYSGGPWTPEFEKLFNQAGMDLDDAFNKLSVPGHKGPHPEQYHQIVYDRLTLATRGLSGKDYKNALQNELNAIGQEILDPNSTLNRIITKR